MHFHKLNQLRSSTPMIDTCAIVPISTCVFALIVSPLVIFATHSDFQALDARPENRIFWPAIAAISVVLALQNRSQLGRVSSPILRLLEQASCGLSVRSARSSDLFSR